ncbi:hypothetical protein A4X13_0g5969 [Tilletia indica]|uniref:Uncharacterized protein n=1 Tax=Tilletia indica TaxID=43049 RepID=A0A177TSR4_9BASI|nr:hypothetical protein A4X13_0g5969 [Tilletia indica]
MPASLVSKLWQATKKHVTKAVVEVIIESIAKPLTKTLREKVAAIETQTRESREESRRELRLTEERLVAAMAEQMTRALKRHAEDEAAGPMRKRARNPEGQRLGLDEALTFEALVKEFKFATKVFGTSAFSRRRLEGALVFAGYVVKSHTLKNVLARHPDTFPYNEADDTYSLVI